MRGSSVNMDWLLSSDTLFGLPKWYFLATILTGFLSYYLREVVKPPTIVCTNGKLKNFLLERMPILQEKYWPTLWCIEGRFQTAIAFLLRSIYPKVKYRREILIMNDGGQVAIDWMEEGCPEDSPIVIILPGLTGDSQTEYIRCLVRSARSAKIRTVVFNYRGLGGCPLKTPRTYNAANWEDLTEVVNHVKSLNPGIPLAATGISMGSLILAKYLASQQGQPEKTLLAALIISSPWNVSKAVKNLEQPGLNLILNRYLASGLFILIDRMKLDNMLRGPWNLDDIMKSKTVREFDSTYTAKQYGFKDEEEYYAASSIDDKMQKIEVPFLCLNAADDPILPLRDIPVEEVKKSKHIAMVITSRGGHIGFLEGIFPLLREQYMCRIFTQYFTEIFASGSELLAEINKEC